jgi:hypothetical protein
MLNHSQNGVDFMKVMKKLAALLLAGALAATAALPTFAAFNATAPWLSTADTQITGVASTTTKMQAYKFIEAVEDNDPQGQSQVKYQLLDWAKTALLAENSKAANDATKVDLTTFSPAIFKTEGGTTTVDDDAVIQALGGTVGVNPGEKDDAANDIKTATNKVLTVLANAAKATTAPAGLPAAIEVEPSNGTATFEDLAVGSYVVVATDPTEIYNPMEISVGLADSDNNNSLDSVVADGTVGKYSHFVTEKDITNGDTIKENLSSASIGDDVEFTLSMNPVPTYPEGSSNKTLYMRDTLSKGLANNKDGKLYINGVEVTLAAYATVVYEDNTADKSNKETNDTVTGDYTGGSTFAVVFNYDALDAYLRGLTGDNAGKRTVEFKYTAKIDTDAVIAVDGNPNAYDVVYTRNPSEGGTYIPGGPGNPNPITPTEKPDWWSDTKDTEKTVYTYGLAVKKVDETGAINAALAGAEFGVYIDPACADGDLLTTMTVAENGLAHLAGIEAGTYYIKETKAPAGYALNDTVVKVVVNKNTSQVYSAYTTKTSEAWGGNSKEAEVFMTQAEYEAAKTYTESEKVDGETAGTTVTTIAEAGNETFKRIVSNGAVYTTTEYEKFPQPRPNAVDVKKYTVTTVYTARPQSTETSNYTVNPDFSVDEHAMAVIQDNKVGNLPALVALVPHCSY